MPITTTHQQLLDSRDALRELSDLPIPVRTALKARKIYKRAQSEMETVQEQIKVIAERHARRAKNEDGSVKVGEDGKDVLIHPLIKRGENGEPDVFNEDAVEIDPARRQAYNDDMKELMETPIALDFDQIAVADLSDPKDPPLKLKIATVFALDWLLKD